MQPLISVVIPTYNRVHLIGEALESVFAQTFKDYEVILIDDGSTDGTEESVKKNFAGRLRYVRQKNQGISSARNHGIVLARGKYVAFLDSDDKWLPKKLAKQAEYLEANPHVGLLCTKLWRYEIGNEEKRETCPPDFPKHFTDLLTGPNFIPTTTTMVRKRCLDAVGVFDPALPVAEDWDLWLRIAKDFKIHCLSDVLAEHRDHPAKTTKNRVKVYEGFWRFYAKNLRFYREFIADPLGYQKRAISFRYLLGTAYLKQGEMRKAFEHIAGALQTSWDIGTYFNRTNSVFANIKYFLKPYGALALSFLGGLFRTTLSKR